MWKYILFILSAFMSCHSQKAEECEDGEWLTLKDFSGLDGCTWMLVREDNSSLEPINLAEFISKPGEGDIYRVEYKERTDLASICLKGKIVQITCATKK